MIATPDIASLGSGSLVGFTLGLDGQTLLLVFGVPMLVIAAAMLLRRSGSGAGFQPMRETRNGSPAAMSPLIAKSTGRRKCGSIGIERSMIFMGCP
ncbi:MAG: hypothetical protein Q8S58_09035, partial [Bosea sp. (in: a-proteobacteria)]|nr:hypothetical protein [Bosea sp. (in: a-proteobacteria)]